MKTLDPVTLTIIVAAGITIAWLIIHILYRASYVFRRAVRSIKCLCGFHAPSGTYEPAPGARDVMRCLYCDDIVHVVGRTKDSLRRTR